MQRAGQTWPIWLILLILILLQVGHQCQATTDCMKNPFASVCRGISAKRSGMSSVPTATSNEQKRQQHLLVASQQQMGQRANELADLLNKLNSLNQQQGAQQQLLAPKPLAELLVRHWAATASASNFESNSPAKTMWPLALGNFIYYERQPLQLVEPMPAAYSAPLSSSLTSSSSFGIGATGNE